jgi:hypothetical protein
MEPVEEKLDYRAAQGRQVMGACPPGPRDRFPGATFLAFRRDALGLLLSTARHYGDITYYRLGAGSISFLIVHPEQVKEILVTHHRHFTGLAFEAGKSITGDLTLPLDNGLKTRATWFTADVGFDLGNSWYLQNTPTAQGLLGSPSGTTFQYFFTNHFAATGAPARFDTPNGLVAPGGEWHVEKPISAVQDQLTLRRKFGRHSLFPRWAPRQLYPGQSLVLYRHPDRCAGQPTLPGPG